MRKSTIRRRIATLLALATMAGGAGLIFGGHQSGPATAHWHFAIVALDGTVAASADL